MDSTFSGVGFAASKEEATGVEDIYYAKDEQVPMEKYSNERKAVLIPEGQYLKLYFVILRLRRHY